MTLFFIFKMLTIAFAFILHHKSNDKLIIKVVNPACQAFGQATYNADLYFPALRVKPSAFARNEAKIFLRIFHEIRIRDAGR